ncbi:hypothetical protein CE91St1_01150 [Parabacteroides goldsteinii]|uniref:DUF3244 domain-containing protein n=1 Tax=Parabacteroides TaxID=375288 RepID=UPI001FBB48D5|nr:MULTISPECIES: DUF3244 domain-containing protein [Parabacteroides]MCM0717709.1 DUF3244 domain-containing protein [Parabacteroides sp. W1-Q-101]GKG70972.1 hypothetical protein CE91St1_01150 [Parabacteroides goldsteinii]GKG76923.1 hypothetical protein CE91St2_01150 [Parabacteroides goldsteinii]
MKSFKLGSIIVLTLLFSIPSFARHRIHFPHCWDQSYKSIIKEPIPFEAIFEDSDNSIQLCFNKKAEGLTVQISDNKGIKIFNETFNASQNEIKTISLNDLEVGEYTIVVTEGNKYAVGKFVL